MPSIMQYPAVTQSSANPAFDLLAVTPNDTTDFMYYVRKLYIGGAGNVKVRTMGGTIVTFYNVDQGQELGPFMIDRVLATGTTATNIVGYM